MFESSSHRSVYEPNNFTIFVTVAHNEYCPSLLVLIPSDAVVDLLVCQHGKVGAHYISICIVDIHIFTHMHGHIHACIHACTHEYVHTHTHSHSHM